MKSYPYIGPEAILERVKPEFKGRRITCIPDILTWVRESGQDSFSGMVVLTYIISMEGKLFISDRHSEHVQCAFGAEVLSAGELTLVLEGEDIEVIDLSNQSTGYCPSVQSWPAVQQALDEIGLEHPGEFTFPIVFGRCLSCNHNAIIKEGHTECSSCGNDYQVLP